MKLLRAFRAVLAAAVLFAAAAGPLGAQTWHWQIVFHPAGGGAINAVSQVDLSDHDVRLSYFTTIQNRRVPIATCRAALSDISGAQTVPNGGRTFLALRLKPGHAAACDSGPQSVAILPVSDDALAPRVANEINGACCRIATSGARPSLAATPSSAATPAPSRSALKPHVVLTDVVENDGVFYFVRVRNRSAGDVTITDGMISNCRAVVFGCGPINGHDLNLRSGAIVTIATVMSSSAPRDPAFTYGYTAQSGDALVEGAGNSAKRAKVWFPKMTAAEVRAAEGDAVVALRSLTAANGQSPAASASAAIVATPPPAYVGVRLVRRGESRLAIGKTGTAAVHVTINSAGLPMSATVMSVSNQQLAPAAIETAISSTYAPAMRNGVNVAGSYDAKFRFDGSDPAVASVPVWRRAPAAAPVPSPAPSPT